MARLYEPKTTSPETAIKNLEKTVLQIEAAKRDAETARAQAIVDAVYSRVPVTEVAEILGVSRPTVHAYVKKAGLSLGD